MLELPPLSPFELLPIMNLPSASANLDHHWGQVLRLNAIIAPLGMPFQGVDGWEGSSTQGMNPGEDSCFCCILLSPSMSSSRISAVSWFPLFVDFNFWKSGVQSVLRYFPVPQTSKPQQSVNIKIPAPSICFFIFIRIKNKNQSFLLFLHIKKDT